MSLLAFAMPGPMELAIIGGILLILFAGRIPKMARAIGASGTEFKKGLQDGAEETPTE